MQQGFSLANKPVMDLYSDTGTDSTAFSGFITMPDMASGSQEFEGNVEAEEVEGETEPTTKRKSSVVKVRQRTGDADGESISTTGSTATEQVEIVKSKETIPPIDKPQIIPNLSDRFMEHPVQEVIKHVLTFNLQGKEFAVEKVREWCTIVADQINEEIKELGLKRYKHVVQVVMSPRSGAGVQCGHKCLWDKETDGFTSDFFMNETLFCVAWVFGVFFYG